MEKFIIEGGHPLSGEVTPAGNKNAALPLLAACLLTDEPVTFHNVPEIMDIRNMRLLLESLGVEFSSSTPHSWRVQAREVRLASLDPDLCRKIRASILLAGPMIARSGEMELPPPGGDRLLLQPLPDLEATWRGRGVCGIDSAGSLQWNLRNRAEAGGPLT